MLRLENRKKIKCERYVMQKIQIKLAQQVETTNEVQK